MIKAVMFDLNGVFLQGEKLSERFERDYGVKAQEFFAALKEMLDVCRKPNAPSCFSLMQPYFTKWGVKFTDTKFLDYLVAGENLVPELVDYAKELKKKGLQIYIFSNNFKERTNYYLTKWPELFALFDKVFFSWQTGFVKSQIEAYTNFLKVTGLKGEECIYFDDSEKNIELAKSLGIHGQIYAGLEETKKFISGLH